jgi:hypothetical protein
MIFGRFVTLTECTSLPPCRVMGMASLFGLAIIVFRRPSKRCGALLIYADRAARCTNRCRADTMARIKGTAT